MIDEKWPLEDQAREAQLLHAEVHELWTHVVEDNNAVVDFFDERKYQEHESAVRRQLQFRLQQEPLCSTWERNVELIKADHGLFDAPFMAAILLATHLSPRLGLILQALRDRHLVHITELQTLLMMHQSCKIYENSADKSLEKKYEYDNTIEEKVLEKELVSINGKEDHEDKALVLDYCVAEDRTKDSESELDEEAEASVSTDSKIKLELSDTPLEFEKWMAKDSGPLLRGKTLSAPLPPPAAATTGSHCYSHSVRTSRVMTETRSSPTAAKKNRQLMPSKRLKLLSFVPVPCTRTRDQTIKQTSNSVSSALQKHLSSNREFDAGVQLISDERGFDLSQARLLLRQATQGTLTHTLTLKETAEIAVQFLESKAAADSSLLAQWGRAPQPASPGRTVAVSLLTLEEHVLRSVLQPAALKHAYNAYPTTWAAKSIARLAVFLQSVQHHCHKLGAAAPLFGSPMPSPFEQVFEVSLFHYSWVAQLHNEALRDMRTWTGLVRRSLQQIFVQKVPHGSNQDTRSEHWENLGGHISSSECALLVQTLYPQQSPTDQMWQQRLLRQLRELAQAKQVAQIGARRLSVLSPNTAFLGGATFRKLGYNVRSTEPLAALRVYSSALQGASSNHDLDVVRTTAEAASKECLRELGSIGNVNIEVEMDSEMAGAFQLPARSVVWVLLEHQLCKQVGYFAPLASAFSEADTDCDGYLSRMEFSNLFLHQLHHDDYSFVPETLHTKRYGRDQIGNVVLLAVEGDIDAVSSEDALQKILKRIDPYHAERIPFCHAATAMGDQSECN